METRAPNNLCMCLHGAGQILVNPTVRSALNLPPPEKLSYAELLRRIKTSLTEKTWHKGNYFGNFPAEKIHKYEIYGPAVVSGRAHRMAIGTRQYDYTMQSIWTRRNESREMNQGRAGRIDLHFLMGMFGLTSVFNDRKDTTLPMIHKKLDRAIAFAEKHASFLENN